MLKVLVVVSNHRPETWSKEQLAGWDVVEYIPFPNIDPEWSVDEVNDEVLRIRDEIYAISERNGSKVSVCLQGEYTFCYILSHVWLQGYDIVIPTTKREVIEEIVDNKVIKKSVFKFVQWRTIRLSTDINGDGCIVKCPKGCETCGI